MNPLHRLLLATLLAAPLALDGQRLQPTLMASTVPGPSLQTNIVVLPVPGLPFNGLETVQRTHPAPDGASITETFQARIARNSAGQVYLETDRLIPAASPTADAPPAASVFTLVDPAANTSTRCTLAARRCLIFPAPVERPRNSRDRISETYLGAKTIDGLVVTGTRATRTLPSPPGTPDPGISISSEWWDSPDLKTTLSVNFTDARNITTFTRLAILDRAEPAPALFAIPADYTLSNAPSSVTAPVVVFSPEPEFSAEARRNKISGNVLLSVVVDESGNPTNINVVRGIGYGLDEKAVEAVQRYKFRPAVRDGTPVKFAMHIEVNFQIFGKQ